ncbi:glutathione binding-like protein [Shewanella phaeophyticola]|uniref:Glutathione binding-like protein n=1 Tax=Shewanella phaeophyticola TaxID=2978345 RepID=A0ABT2P0D7_9GAMM|nr:glutathione binding-like protein [Shewanella sp. KJ10-1]MCT8986093.1 glutathione binding-like protein [Shewanella sp. KJ10-1]
MSLILPWLRYIQLYLGLPDDRIAEYHALHAKGYKALSVMEFTLSQQPFLCGEQFTLADIALYAYTNSTNYLVIQREFCTF